MNKEESINLLRNAKERLFEKGWLQNSLGKSSGPNCLVGAVHYELGNKYLSQSDMQIYRVFTALQDIIYPDNEKQNLDDWNDSPERTFDEVIDVIDRTIKRFEMEKE